MRLRPCCIRTCTDKSSIRHRFPNHQKDLPRMLVWLQIINNPKLFTLSHELIYNSHRVCRSHFEEKYYIGNKLTINAVPTKYLNNTVGENMVLDTRKILLDAYRKFRVQHKIVKGEHNYCKSVDAVLETNTNVVPEAYFDVIIETNSNIPNISVHENSSILPITNSNVIPEIRIVERNTNVVPHIIDTRKIDPNLNVQLKSNIQKYKNRIAYLEKTNVMLRERCKNAKKFRKDSILESLQSTLSRMNPVAANFIVSQIRNHKSRLKGRRFTEEDKLFALSLYNTSSNSYQYLSQIFSLPSNKTLQRLLNNLPVVTETSEAVKSIMLIE